VYSCIIEFQNDNFTDVEIIDEEGGNLAKKDYLHVMILTPGNPDPFFEVQNSNNCEYNDKKNLETIIFYYFRSQLYDLERYKRVFWLVFGNLQIKPMLSDRYLALDNLVSIKNTERSKK